MVTKCKKYSYNAIGIIPVDPSAGVDTDVSSEW